MASKKLQIVGGFNIPQADFNQTDETKSDFIKNKPELGELATKDEVAKTDLASDVQASLDKADSALQSVPSEYVTETELTNKGYLTDYTETDPTVPAWAKATSKPSYTASEVGAVPTSRTVNGKALSANITLSASDVDALPDTTVLADLTSDSTHRTVTDAEKEAWNAKSDFSGSYNDLTNKPTIPTVNNATLTIQKNGTTVKTFTANSATDVIANITVPTKVSELTNDSGFKTTDNNTTYSLSKSGSTITLTGSDGSSTSVTDADTNTTYDIATSNTAGLVKIGYTENGKNYPVELSDGKMFVNVPWTDNNTVYTHPTSGVTAGSYNKVTVDANGHVTEGSNPTTLSGHGITNAYTKTEVDSLLDGKAGTHEHPYIPTSEKGAASGVATLDDAGKVPTSQLPSYVDDVLEYSAKSSFPTTGETGKIYVDTATNKTYRWSGSAYTEISASLALGTTSSTAYYGDKGKIAYDHSQEDHAPSDAQKNSDITKAEIEAKLTGTITSHTHTVTHPVTSVAGKTGAVTLDKSDVGLGNVENKSSATIRGELTSDNVTTALGYTPLDADDAYTLPAADSSLGGVKSGGDVTISDGVITVNDDSHNHTIANVDGLQDALDSKQASGSYVSSTSTGVQSIAGGLVVGGTSATATGKGRIMLTGHTNPLIGLQAIDSDGNQLTPYYFQVTNNKMYLGPTSAKALAFDSSGNTTIPASLTVAGTITEGGTALSSKYAASDSLATVATSGKYSDLSGTPTIPDALADLSADSTHRTVTDTEKATWNAKSDFSGSYNDLTDTPYIPAEVTVDSALSSTSTNPVQNKVINTALAGKAASSHNHSAANITSETLSSDRLPTVPITKGGTGATTAADALTNLGLTATASEINKLDGLTATTTELNYMDGVTSNVQTQLNNKLDVTSSGEITVNKITIPDTSQYSPSAGDASLTQYALTLSAGDRLTTYGDGYINFNGTRLELPHGKDDTIALLSDIPSASTYTHPSYTARTGKPTANQTPAFGGTATVSQITSDATGHVTGATDRTITIPSTLSNGTSTAGLIKTSSTVTSSSGYTACPVISGVPYYKNTTYSAATTSANGLMTSAMVTKLNGIATGANNYTLPAATDQILGGVKVKFEESTGTLTISTT